MILEGDSHIRHRGLIARPAYKFSNARRNFVNEKVWTLDIAHVLRRNLGAFLSRVGGNLRCFR